MNEIFASKLFPKDEGGQDYLNQHKNPAAKDTYSTISALLTVIDMYQDIIGRQSGHKIAISYDVAENSQQVREVTLSRRYLKPRYKEPAIEIQQPAVVFNFDTFYSGNGQIIGYVYEYYNEQRQPVTFANPARFVVEPAGVVTYLEKVIETGDPRPGGLDNPKLMPEMA